MRAALLSPFDRPAYTVVNGAAEVPMLFLCEHAGKAVPMALGDLGISESDLNDHIGWDIGAEGVTRHLADMFGATAVLATYSRLVIDANRPLNHPGSMPEESDARLIPGNTGLSDIDRRARQEACFWPYHRMAARHRVRLGGRIPPVLVFVHSFTPQMADGSPRPWEVGILWDEDERMAKPMLSHLAGVLGGKVGDNEPYTGKGGTGYSAEVHAKETGLPHIMLEVRNDLIRDEAGQRHWAGVLADALRACPDVQRVIAFQQSNP